ncbi:MAG: hypothetical protein PVJ95_13850 [Cellvibrionales bacterium]
MSVLTELTICATDLDGRDRSFEEKRRRAATAIPKEDIFHG